MSNVPENLKYAKSHEWIRLEGEEAVIGISDYAQDSLGDITFIELPEEGDSLAAGESFGVVESVKAASDLYLPAGGEVVAVNSDLEGEPEKVNQSPYEEGWLIRIRLSDPSDLEKLLSPEDYRQTL